MAADAPDVGAWLAKLGACWDEPALAARLHVAPSRRMTRTLGCYDLRRREIRIAAWLLEAPSSRDDLRREVLCHEAAHAVVHERHGEAARPHGAEWRALMRRAGYAPRVRIPGIDAGEVARRAGRAFEHRCPVCDKARILSSRQRRLRCRACVESGRSGELAIALLS